MVMIAMIARHSGTRPLFENPKPDCIASVPPAIETATVRM